ncbi:MAG: ROK family protein [Bacteroidia bacterium]|nr:ROK family protein [Bacteroidia bacterium]
MKPLWGIDLGGTKIEGIVIDAADNYRTLARKRIPTERAKGYQHTLGRIAHLVNLLEEETSLQPAAIGMGTPGAMDPDTEKLKNSNSQQLLNQPLQKDLEKLLKVPMKLANDANCFAIAETKLGIVAEQLPQAKVVFGIIMGTGVGGGVVIEGKVLNGRHGIGGEWGHNVLDISGGPCYCGKVGCVETLLSGPALENFYKSISGINLSFKEIYEKAEGGEDLFAIQTIDRLLHFFGKALAVVVNILDPDAIVIGGGLGNIPELYDQGVKEIEKHVFNPILRTPILKPKLGDSAGVFGAAMLVE